MLWPEEEKNADAPGDTPLAEAVRDACPCAALSAYEDAGIYGLGAEGRWECAIAAIQGIDLEAVLTAARSSLKPSDQPPAGG